MQPSIAQESQIDGPVARIGLDDWGNAVYLVRGEIFRFPAGVSLSYTRTPDSILIDPSSPFMPSSSGPQKIGDVLGDVIDQLGIRRQLDEARVVEMWATLAGPQINGVTKSAWVHRQTLYVKITSAAWRQELTMRRSEWCERLNDELGAELVEKIVFR